MREEEHEWDIVEQLPTLGAVHARGHAVAEREPFAKCSLLRA